MATTHEVLTFSNFSQDEFTLGDFAHSPHDAGFNWIQTPSNPLAAGASQTLETDDHIPIIGNVGVYSVYCWWQTPKGTYFGISIFIDAYNGSWESWSVYWGTTPPNDNYTLAPNGITAPYTLPTDVGYNILCKPDWSDPLTVVVTISDLPPAEEGESQ